MVEIAVRLSELATETKRAGDALAAVCEQLAVAIEVPRATIDRAVEDVLTAGRALREVILQGCDVANERPRQWATQDELLRVVDDLSSRLQAMAKEDDGKRLRALADELRDGTLIDTKSMRRQRLEQMRSLALDEVMGAAAKSPVLPWPAEPVPSVVRWLAEDEQAVEQLKSLLPAVADFLAMLDPAWWAYEARQVKSGETKAADDAPGGPTPLQEPAPSPTRIDVKKAREGLNASAAIVSRTIVETASLDPDHTTGRPRLAAPTALVTPLGLGAPLPPPDIHLPSGFAEPVEESLVSADADSSGLDSVEEATLEHSDRSPLALADDAPQSTSYDFPREEPSGSEFPALEPITSTQVRPARQLPGELGSFASFCENYWRDKLGDLALAPWRSANFAQALEDRAAYAMREGQFARLVLFARAGDALKFSNCPNPNDVGLLLMLLGGPRTALVDDEDRHNRLARSVEHEAGASLAARLAIFLEAMIATPSRQPPRGQIYDLAESAGFSGAMARVIEGFFLVGSGDDDVLGRVRSVLQAIPERSPEELAQRISDAESTLRKSIKELWSAAGGRIERTHCREAWQEFITAAQLVFDDLLARKDWDDVRRLDALFASYTKTANKFEVKFSDRHRMDRAAGDLVAKARTVVAARREGNRRTRILGGPNLNALVSALQAVRNGSGTTENDAPFLPVLERLLKPGEDGPDDAIGTVRVIEFYKRPAMLESLPILPLGDPQNVDATQVRDPVAAAAHLIVDTPLGLDKSPPNLSRYLRDIDRDDLLVHVVPVSDTDAKFAAGALGKSVAAANRVLGEARSLAVALNAIAHPSATAFSSAVTSAEDCLSSDAAQDVNPEMLLGWVSMLSKFGRDTVAESLPEIRASFERRGPTTEERLRFDQALRSANYAEALALAHGEGVAPPPEDRATLWRFTAAQEFPDPRKTLRAVRHAPEYFCKLWVNGIRANGDDDSLRNAFLSLVFDRLLAGKAGKSSRDSTRRETIVNMEPIRTAIARAGLNPSFVPQVTTFRDIAVLTPNVAPTANTFVRSTAELLAKGPNGRMTVLLAPGITPPVREQLREELRKRSGRGVAIIDDLDVVRLLNPNRQAVNPLLALLELVLEQQPKWAPVSPFEMHEGQHTKQEMFVGRRDEADALSQKALYSRVFSGRRLGKSALLKHIHDSQEKAKLPSGNHLRVVYVPIVGLDSEDAVVRGIVKAFEKLGCPAPGDGRPADRLRALVETYLRKEPKISVLVFLDEADMFIEAQIRQYQRDLEKCLTWCMRSELEHARDARDLPRIRFVFAGYRATHRMEGAWANWGDVLRLRPLSRSDAARLISGPLSRLGINATSEAASIAYRCGYQPAILVRFGQQLLEHLDNTLTPAKREGVAISPEQVAAVYQSPAVQQEIRTIVWNNFQGNPFGQIVFAALLLEFARMPPSAALDDAPTRVLERLRGLVPGFLSDESIDGPAVDRIARTLRDFVDRSLIHEVHSSTRSYRLQFPHQLSVLLQEDQAAVIRREASTLGGDRLDAIEEVHALVPRVALEDLSYALVDEGFTAAITTTHWAESLEQGAANIAMRLGYTEATADTVPEERIADVERLAIPQATPESAERVLRAPRRPAGAHPLFVGGLDLLRWGIRRDRESHDIEIATVPRLSLVQLRWWFERVRGINWSGTNPAVVFAERTGGIPFLVGLLDREIARVIGLDGASATDGHVQDVLEGFERGLDLRAKDLAGRDPSVALEKREQELLVMIALASGEAIASPTPEKRRTDLLDMLISPHEYADLVPALKGRRGLTPDDHLPLSVLLRSGILPSEPKATRTDPFERLQVLASTDPAQRLAAVVEQCLLT